MPEMNDSETKTSYFEIDCFMTISPYRAPISHAPVTGETKASKTVLALITI